ncbi:MAG: acyl-CoA thioesterase [Anaerolinea sp.]|nr:acyl-CoA thioesterase [Anaerolinea sp.]
MGTPTYTTFHLVKSEDLNHHGTLYAGRTAEWFVESGFIAAASLTKPENIVCLKIHGMTFTAPIPKGSLAKFDSKVIFTGKSKIVVSIALSVKNADVVKGYITFVNVDSDNQPLPHGITIVPETDEEKELYEIGNILR